MRGLALVELDDREAVERCRAGGDGPDHAAFRVLYERHEPEIRKLLASLLRAEDQVDDALQETFVRFYRSLGGFDLARPVRPYLLTVARNVAIDALAKLKSRVPEAEPGFAPSAQEGALRRERSAAIQESLEALAPEHRSLITLRYTHALKQEEIAGALGCTVRTVRNRLRVAGTLFERELVRRSVVPPGGAEVGS